MVGTYKAFWQEESFAASQNILTMRSPYLTRYTALFICNCIGKAIEGKYSYGNNIKAGTFGNTSIFLPMNEQGKPDYDFMERYVKKLPFSFAAKQGASTRV